MNERTPLLVLGLGNVLLEDDGAGAAAVSLLLDRYDVPDGARVLDGGTLGLSLLPYLESADAVILVDAVRADAAPGEILRLEGDDVAPAVATRLSVHQIGVVDLLDGARWLGRLPKTLVLVGVVPLSMELGVRLSDPVQRSLDALIARVVDEAGRIGFVFEPRREEKTPDRSIDVARLAGTR